MATVPELFLPTAVIWDWDNTVVWSWNDVYEAMTAVRAKYGLPEMPRAQVLDIFCRRSTRELFPTSEWFGPENWEAAWNDYNTFLKDARNRNGIVPLDDVLPVIEWYQAQGIPQFVLSNKNGGALRREVSIVGAAGTPSHDWSHYFVAVVGAGDAVDGQGTRLSDKPSAESVTFTLAKGNLTPNATILFIGDSVSDVKSANNSGCTPLLIGTEKEADAIRDQDHAPVSLVFPDFKTLLAALHARSGAWPAPPDGQILRPSAALFTLHF